MSNSDNPRRALVTGASGYIGGLLVPALLQRGWQVRVLTRSRSSVTHKPWHWQVEIVEGDATCGDDVASSLRQVDVAYYLLHSMDGQGDFVQRDRELAQTFATAAREAGVGRVVYLGGLHPDDEELSPHLASRVEVGEILLGSGVPTAVLQAGVVIGDGSASFNMLRHLTERLPAFVAPRWINNRIQPIWAGDAVHYLAEAALLAPQHNRTFDIGGPDVLTYGEMMQQYAATTGLGRRWIATVPVLTPGLASLWVGLVTPVDRGIARPLVGSLVHDAVADEDELATLVPEPPGGRASYVESLRRATATLDPHRWRRALKTSVALVGAAAVSGSVLSDPKSSWFRQLQKPRWQPPSWAFPVVWTALYAETAVISAAVMAEGEDAQASSYRRALIVNMVLNAAWSGVFFRLKSPVAATGVAAALALSSGDLVRRAWPHGKGKAAGLSGYAAWSAFATGLSAAIARRNAGCSRS